MKFYVFLIGVFVGYFWAAMAYAQDYTLVIGKTQPYSIVVAFTDTNEAITKADADGIYHFHLVQGDWNINGQGFDINSGMDFFLMPELRYQLYGIKKAVRGLQEANGLR